MPDCYSYAFTLSPLVPCGSLTGSLFSDSGSRARLSRLWISGQPVTTQNTHPSRPRIGRYSSTRTRYRHCHVCCLQLAQSAAAYSSTLIAGETFPSTPRRFSFTDGDAVKRKGSPTQTVAGRPLRSDRKVLVLTATGAKPLSGCYACEKDGLGRNVRDVCVRTQDVKNKDMDQSCVHAIVNTSESFHYQYHESEIQEETNRKSMTRRKPSRTGNSARPPRPRLTTAEEAEIFTRISVAVMVGALIGVERRAASANAGIRTLTLVSLGSAIFSLTAMHGFGGDPARMSAAISTGVGFLGSGAINGEIPGGRRQLVTGASIWIAAALGLAAACGLFTLALSGAFLTIWVLRYHLVLTVIVNSFRRSRVLLRKRARLQSNNRNNGDTDGDGDDDDDEHGRDSLIRSVGGD